MDISEIYNQPETIIDIVDRRKHGMWVLFALKMAYEKWQWMSPSEQKQEERRMAGSKSALDKPRSYYQEKFASRKSNADVCIGVEAKLEVFDLDGDELEVGTLEYYDFRDGILALENENGESTTIEFAEPLPIPTGLEHQRYYGTKKLVKIDLLSIASEKDWLLKYL